MSTKLTDLTALTLPPTGDDLFYIVNDPLVTPGSKKVTLANLLNEPVLLENLGTDWNKYALGFGMFRNIRTIGNADIVTLTTDNVTLVPDPGADLIVTPHLVSVIPKFAAGAYTNVDNATEFVLAWDVSISTMYARIDQGGVSCFSAFDQIFPLAPGALIDGSGENWPPGDEISRFAHRPFYINVENETVPGILTGGHANNTLTVVVDYTLVSVA